MFPETEVILIDDSAAYMGNDFIPACWQQRLRDLWGLDNTLPEGCTETLDVQVRASSPLAVQCAVK